MKKKEQKMGAELNVRPPGAVSAAGEKI